jgi:hypothetical protein
MRDFFFFPLAAALASTFIFVAAEPYATRLPTGAVSGGGRNALDVTVQGDELNRFVLGDQAGVNIDLIRPEGGKAFLRIDRKAGGNYEDPRLGPHLVLAEDLEFALESRPIEVVIEARSVGDFPASQFEANYFAKSESESGWQRFTLTREFQSYTLTFFTPKRGREEGYDFIGVRPVTPDKHRVMDIRSVEIRSAGKKGTPPAVQQTGIVP